MSTYRASWRLPVSTACIAEASRRYCSPTPGLGRVATEALLKWILTGDVNREVVEMDAQFLPGASTLPNDEAADAQST